MFRISRGPLCLCFPPVKLKGYIPGVHAMSSHSLPRPNRRREAPWSLWCFPQSCHHQPAPRSAWGALFSKLACSMVFSIKIPAVSRKCPHENVQALSGPTLFLTEGLQTRNKAVKHCSHRDSGATNYMLQSL